MSLCIYCLSYGNTVTPPTGNHNLLMHTHIVNVQIIGLATYYAWARAKHFGCHSVCLS